MIKRYGLVGAGGFGREVMPLVKQALARELASGAAELYFLIEGAATTQVANDVRVLTVGEFNSLGGDRYFNVAIADSQVRERIALTMLASGAVPFPISAANVVVMDGNEIGEGAILTPFTTITSNARIGRFFHANLYSYIAHDCIIGDFVTFAPGVKCNGNIVIGDRAYIGTGAVLKQGSSREPLQVGAGAIIGMGAIVTRNVPPETTVVGNPARPMEPKR